MLHYYYRGLPFALAPSIMISTICGMTEMIHDVDKVNYPHHNMFNFIGIVSFGALIGFSYPISMPLLTGRYLYRNFKN